MIRLSALCWNIRHGLGSDLRRDLDRQAKVIRESGADLVLLQEVDRQMWRSGRQDQPRLLAAATGLPHVAFGASLRLFGGEYGNALLSRWPLSEVAVRRVPGPWWTEPRSVLAATVAVAGVPLRLLCTHLALNARQRRRGVAVLIDLVREWGDRPLLLGGDLNAEPGATELLPLERRLTEVSGGAGPTYPARWPLRQIDHLFAGGGLRVERCAVLNSAASDHRPVFATLTS